MFKNVDPTVLKETRFIAGVVLILTALQQLVFLLLGKWDYTVILGSLWGAFLAIGNFFLMARTVAKALELEPEKAKKKVQASQQGRMLMLLALCVVGALIPFFHTVASLVPHFFPRIAVAIRGATMKGE